MHADADPEEWGPAPFDSFMQRLDDAFLGGEGAHAVGEMSHARQHDMVSLEDEVRVGRDFYMGIAVDEVCGACKRA